MSSQDDLGDEIDDTEAALHRCHLAVFLLDSSRRRSRFHAHSLNAVRYLADSFANQSVDASLTCNSSVFYVQSFSAPAADTSNFVISNEHSIRTVQLNRSNEASERASLRHLLGGGGSGSRFTAILVDFDLADANPATNNAWLVDTLAAHASRHTQQQKQHQQQRLFFMLNEMPAYPATLAQLALVRHVMARHAEALVVNTWMNYYHALDGLGVPHEKLVLVPYGNGGEDLEVNDPGAADVAAAAGGGENELEEQKVKRSSTHHWFGLEHDVKSAYAISRRWCTLLVGDQHRQHHLRADTGAGSASPRAHSTGSVSFRVIVNTTYTYTRAF